MQYITNLLLQLKVKLPPFQKQRGGNLTYLAKPY